jgi:serine/threonine-protein kinase HipA
MSLPEIKYCPGTLAENNHTYNVTALRSVFNGRKVSHVLPFSSPEHSEEAFQLFMENMKHLSISGVQQKLGLIQEKNKLRLTKENEQGTHILKPIPALLSKANMLPANEHLTMQIASQVFGINTAANALIFFEDGPPAYITKRFDVKKGGGKLGKEDFATLAGKTKDIAGEYFKYNSSYEEVGLLIQKHLPAWKIEIEKYFSQIVFNYLVSNGDAHLKNFSILETTQGDYVLSPSYDLVNTRMHVKDTTFAFANGLFSDDFKSTAYKKNNYPGAADFIEFAKRIGIEETRAEKLLLPFMLRQDFQEELVYRSFLNDDNKRGYQLMYNTRRNYLNAK